MMDVALEMCAEPCGEVSCRLPGQLVDTNSEAPTQFDPSESTLEGGSREDRLCSSGFPRNDGGKSLLFHIGNAS